VPTEKYRGLRMTAVAVSTAERVILLI